MCVFVYVVCGEALNMIILYVCGILSAKIQLYKKERKKENLPHV